MTSPELSSLAFVLTTHCNLSCSECSVNVPRIARPEHYDLPYIKRAASYFHGIENVVVTGGEPTGHPQFAEIVPNLKTWFGCRTLSLATNGYRVIEHAGVLTHFDDIYVSHYENNQAEVAFLAENFSDRWPAGPTIHACAARRARHPVPCDLLYARIKYMHGRVYPCCVVPAGAEGLGIPLTETWREDILKATPPCASCFFAREGDPAASAALGPERMFAALSGAAPATGDMRGPAVWPRPRDEIAIYDIDFDSWMGREAELVVEPGAADTRLMLYLESHAPPRVHPITLTFDSEAFFGSHVHVVTRPGLSVAQVPLGRLLRQPGEARIRLRSDRTFVPSRLDPANSDHRELSVRIRSAIFMAGMRPAATERARV